METRKLQEVGGGTFTVSIPKQWAVNHGFEVGMELRLYTHCDGSILVRSSDMDVDRLNDATVSVDNDGPESIERAVRTAHAAGFETITLRRTGGFSDAERSSVRTTVRSLVGTNIVATSETEITVRHLLDPGSVSVRQSTVQLQHAVVSLLRDATRALADADDNRAQIRDRADEARRSAQMVTRHFSRSLISHAELDALDVSRPELFAYYATACRLETVTDQTVQIANTGGKLSEPPTDIVSVDVRAIADDVADAVDRAVTSVLDADLTEIHRARTQFDDAIERIEAVETSLYDGTVSGPVATAAALSSVLSNLRRVIECGQRVADTAARSGIRSENIDI